ncbi:hypothetical protein WICPIJ_000873 [Wickerhamomyces pijperi]|uniref:Uncharacterized protein n=1 Tax=Wickerhamomyces pijperi TaxID=599730 RepID=A0A9P8QCM3_WICPI|nr:hypothetical protein WICPIJ_000873 [Wickerhamomyces pijperi]
MLSVLTKYEAVEVAEKVSVAAGASTVVYKALMSPIGAAETDKESKAVTNRVENCIVGYSVELKLEDVLILLSMGVEYEKHFEIQL